jgi:hypothetical protein
LQGFAMARRLAVFLLANSLSAYLGFVHLGRFMETTQGPSLSGA